MGQAVATFSFEKAHKTLRPMPAVGCAEDEVRCLWAGWRTPSGLEFHRYVIHVI